MELREKVIKGFECCLPMTTRDGHGDCDNCPYDRPITLEGGVCECVHELMVDTLAILKAQEAETADAPKPDSDIGCWYDITHNYTLEQVVSALKAQEPRVMTLEEVEQKNVMWLETNNHEWNAMNGIHETVLRTDDDRYDFSDIIVQFVDQEGCEIICARDRFGIEWRCWTSRPAIEQMNNTPWEERDNGEKAE